ncbi:hypothetical protein ACXZ1K_12875 [Pedobacter sp. PWIIR3]
MTHAFLKFKYLLLFCYLPFIATSVSSQTKDGLKLGKVPLALLQTNIVTIKGNIKTLIYPLKGAGKYVFRYTDMLSGKVKELVASIEADAEKFYNAGNNAAGKRFRKGILELKGLAQTIRTEV